ncbi:hypothetical protein [Streptomyces varsoviensis]|uniref:Uncharacterized protein n=1 Tax=Streptomyces varsoviensis TaxID=67373 RepID=A0ABR5IUM4_9ACTN|nr:hypothetical protein [Streptomyces varsoviensis]KOG76082.1 hypothetical protein ADK38_39970 [Streptomyces varsoviensis]
MSDPSYPLAIVPYAQAAAVIEGDGTILRALGIDEVRKTADGSYAVKVSGEVDLEKSVPTATLIARADPSVPAQIYLDLQADGGDPHTFGVTTYAGAARVDSPFTVIVP